MVTTQKSETFSRDLIDFIDSSPSAFQAVVNAKKMLKKEGFKELKEENHWKFKPGGIYFITRNDSSLVAFRVGTELPFEAGFSCIGAHTDSPSFKLKQHSEHLVAGLTVITTEMYGGPIISSWLDRDLGVAGRVVVKRKSGWKSESIVLADVAATIPNPAIHLNREVNKGFEYNKQTQLKAVLSVKGVKPGTKNILSKAVAKQCGVKMDEIGALDLYLFDEQAGTISPDKRLVTVSRLDNLASCHGALKALIEAKPVAKTQVILLFDNEEIGSRTAMGADSPLMATLLERVVISSGGSREDFYRAIAKSILLSADGAHALHPSFKDKHDPDYAPLINGGPVIKQSATFRYATTAITTELFRQWADDAGVPIQYAINRSDMPSGSTIGPISSAGLGIATVDAGIPMLAMHSTRELTGAEDLVHFYMIMKTLFNK